MAVRQFSCLGLVSLASAANVEGLLWTYLLLLTPGAGTSPSRRRNQDTRTRYVSANKCCKIMAAYAIAQGLQKGRYSSFWSSCWRLVWLAVSLQKQSHFLRGQAAQDDREMTCDALRQNLGEISLKRKVHVLVADDKGNKEQVSQIIWQTNQIPET